MESARMAGARLAAGGEAERARDAAREGEADGAAEAAAAAGAEGGFELRRPRRRGVEAPALLRWGRRSSRVVAASSVGREDCNDVGEDRSKPPRVKPCPVR